MPLRKPPIPAARTALHLLDDRAQRDMLLALHHGEGQSTAAGLAHGVIVMRTKGDERVAELLRHGVLAEKGGSRARELELTAAGRALAQLILLLVDWIGSHPNPIPNATESIGWRAFSEVASAWELGVLEWIVRRGPGPAEVGGGYGGISGRSLREEVERMVSGCLLELSAPDDPAAGGRYRLTHWGGRGLGLLAALAAWERVYLGPGRSGEIALQDAIVALRATLPLVEVAPGADGVCLFVAECDPDSPPPPGECKVAAVWARFRAGRVVALGEGKAPEDAAAWVRGSFGQWLEAVVGGRIASLRTDGVDAAGKRLATGAVDQLHQRLFPRGVPTSLGGKPL